MKNFKAAHKLKPFSMASMTDEGTKTVTITDLDVFELTMFLIFHDMNDREPEDGMCLRCDCEKQNCDWWELDLGLWKHVTIPNCLLPDFERQFEKFILWKEPSDL